MLRDEASRPLKFFPFCSERCKLIDLGAWLDGDYRIVARAEDAPDEPPAGRLPASDEEP